MTPLEHIDLLTISHWMSNILTVLKITHYIFPTFICIYSSYYNFSYASCGALVGTGEIPSENWSIEVVQSCIDRTSNEHSTNWVRKEGNVLFNDALNTFYLRLYGVTHMVKHHSDSEREETCCRHMGYSFWLAARVLLYASSHRQDNTAFVTPVVEYWLEWQINWVRCKPNPVKEQTRMCCIKINDTETGRENIIFNRE